MNKQLITEFSDGSQIYFASGKFDSWCVYIENEQNNAISPKDIQYFESLNKLRDKKSATSIYQDFIVLYDKTSNAVDNNVLTWISTISKTYGDYSLYTHKLFVTLYATMIAEINKENTKLGKRIKRLGVHKILIENEPIHSAANFMRGMPWREIDKLCKQRGF